MRGRRRHIASLLADALGGRAEARRAAAAAAFAEACGSGLSRQVALRGVAPGGRLLVVARTAAWGREVARLAPEICARVNARLGAEVASAIEVRVGPVSER